MSTYITRKMIDPDFDTQNRDDGNGLFRQLFRAAVRKWRQRKMIASLEALDDAVLRDIGIYRGVIRPVVAGFSDRELGMEPVAVPAKSGGTVTRDIPKGSLSAVATQPARRPVIA